MSEILKMMPDDVWMILAIAIASLVLFIGLRVVRKGFTIKTPGVEISCITKDNKDELA